MNGPESFTALPPEVLSIICKYAGVAPVVRFCAVSKEWREATLQWAAERSRLDVGSVLRRYKQSPSEEFILRLVPFFPNLQAISLNSWRWPETFPHVASLIMENYYSEKLQCFEAKAHPIVLADLKNLSLGCPNITKLVLSGCAMVDDRFLVRELRPLWPLSLSEIDISDCKAVTKTGLATIVSYVPTVRAYRLQRVSGSMVLSAPLRTKEQTGTITVSGCRNLQSLTVHDNVRATELRLSDNESLLGVSIEGPLVASLTLSGCRSLRSVELKCPKLRSLNMNLCSRLRQIEFDHLKNLEALFLNGNSMLDEISLDLPSLQKLDTAGCNRLQRMKVICPNLKELKFPTKPSSIHLSVRCHMYAEITALRSEWYTVAGGPMMTITSMPE